LINLIFDIFFVVSFTHVLYTSSFTKTNETTHVHVKTRKKEEEEEEKKRKKI